ncbi:MAG: hypothetical protein JXQ67_11275 [Campylobacterales bacterium]|nr:hypothetical protein [Campylobacterales bacterium]
MNEQGIIENLPVLVLAVLFLVSFFYNLRLIKMLKERESGDAELIKQAYFNQITMLPNANNAEIVLSEQIERAKRRDKDFLVTTVALLNYSDELVVELSNIIVEVLRNEDFVAHIENSKFLLIFNEYLEDKNYALVLGRLKESITQHKKFEVSIKSVIYPKDFDSFETLLETLKH